MTQYTLKNACMIVLIMLAGIALSPTWAGGDHHQAKIRIVGDDFEIDETDVSDLEVGESMSFYTDNGREVLVIREADGFDISVDGESLDLPVLGDFSHGGPHGVKVITKEFICEGEEECDHAFINIHESHDIEFLRLSGDDLALDFEILREFHCDNEEECDHEVKVWHHGGDFEFEHGDGSVLEFDGEDGNKVIIIKQLIHVDEGEEI